MNVSLAQSKPFEMLLDLEVGGIIIDLHNDYDCVEIVEVESDLVFVFNRCNAALLNHPEKVEIRFIAFQMIEGDFSDAKLHYPLTLANLNKSKTPDSTLEYTVGFMEWDDCQILVKDLLLTF